MSSTATSEPFVYRPASVPPAAGPGGGADQVDATRREIAELVREVAVAVRSDRTPDEFFGLLIDRTARAMAAEGVVVWEIHHADDAASIGHSPAPTLTASATKRLGRVTDQSLAAESVATHQRLLAEVATTGQPVVVPPTPAATDANTPANPAGVPVALVPIELEPSPGGSSYLLEVFLEPDCGIATQRGYLRFVAQMADLAGEFLRGEQLRRLCHVQQLAVGIDQAVITLHKIRSRAKLHITIVDQVAELFGFERVGLCAGDPPRLLAVSHVETIDRQSGAAKRLEAIAGEANRSRWNEDAQADAEGLLVRAVIVAPDDPRLRIVCLQDTNTEPIDRRDQELLHRYVSHASLALDHLNRLDAIPGGRILASLSARDSTGQAAGRRKLIGISLLIAVIAIAMLIPVPLVVSAPATITAARVQIATAPRAAIVEKIHAEHGQNVKSGELLVTLADPDLEAQITALVGRRAVLAEQQSRWTEALVDTSASQLDRLEQVQSESRMVREEIHSIDDQLAVLRRASGSLEIRAAEAGMVDAWQIRRRLQSRPLRRGDAILQVIAHESPWTVLAQVPATRIASIQQAADEGQLTATVSLDAEPATLLNAELQRIGPAIRSESDQSSATAVLLELSDNAAESVAIRQASSDQNGAPARVMLHCGRAAAGYVLFQGLFRSIGTTMALYFGGQQGSQI